RRSSALLTVFAVEPLRIVTVGETPLSGVMPCCRIVIWAFQVSPGPVPSDGGPRPAVAHPPAGGPPPPRGAPPGGGGPRDGKADQKPSHFHLLVYGSTPAGLGRFRSAHRVEDLERLVLRDVSLDPHRDVVGALHHERVPDEAQLLVQLRDVEHVLALEPDAVRIAVPDELEVGRIGGHELFDPAA